MDVALLEATANGRPLNAGQVALVRELAGVRVAVSARARPGRHRQDHRPARPRAGLAGGRRRPARSGPVRGRRRGCCATPTGVAHGHDRETAAPPRHRPAHPHRTVGEPCDRRRGRHGRHHRPRPPRRPRPGRGRQRPADRRRPATGRRRRRRHPARPRRTDRHRHPGHPGPVRRPRRSRRHPRHPRRRPGRASTSTCSSGRVHVGDEHTAPDSAYTAWTADRAAGRDTLLLAATRAQVTALNQPRPRRPARPPRRRPRTARGRCALADGTAASAGDEIITRRNDRRLAITSTDWVKNGDRFTVRLGRRRRVADVVHRDTGRQLTLPAAYVRRACRARLREHHPRRPRRHRRHLPHRAHRHRDPRTALRRPDPRPRRQPPASALSPALTRNWPNCARTPMLRLPPLICLAASWPMTSPRPRRAHNCGSSPTQSASCTRQSPATPMRSTSPRRPTRLPWRPPLRSRRCPGCPTCRAPPTLRGRHTWPPEPSRSPY